jgi:hypothetical protein
MKTTTERAEYDAAEYYSLFGANDAASTVRRYDLDHSQIPNETEGDEYNRAFIEALRGYVEEFAESLIEMVRR